LTLDRFVVGPCNEMGFAAARAAAEPQDTEVAGGPTFLHGGCGLGKTHLLRGLVERAARLRPDAKVLYTTGEQFTNQYIDALRHGKLDAFRRQVRGLDLLAVDDVHFLARKEKTQEEFLHCFDELHLSGGRVVLASDQHPKLIDALSEKLVSRCVSGLVVQLHPPDPQTRLALVQQLAKRRGLVLAPGIDEAVAGRCLGSVRELAGLMHRLHALATLGTPDGKPAGGSPSVGHALLSRLAQQDASAAPPRPIRIEEVLDSVCQYLGVHPDQVRGRGRQRPIVLARQLTVYLAKRLTHMSYPEIARALGRSNHSTVITADQRMDRQYDANQPQQLPGRTEPVGSVELVERLRREVMQHR
jgi:chromosomal replication initiator protein